MRLRIEIADDAPDEVIIRSHTLSDEVKQLQHAIETVIGTQGALALTLGQDEHYVPLSDILFFETDSGHIAVHTADRLYRSEQKLYELAALLPRRFVRVSKSCIVNSGRISSLCRGVTGSAEAHFTGTDKIAYISRMYYKILKDIIYETRVLK